MNVPIVVLNDKMMIVRQGSNEEIRIKIEKEIEEFLNNISNNKTSMFSYPFVWRECDDYIVTNFGTTEILYIKKMFKLRISNGDKLMVYEEILPRTIDDIKNYMKNVSLSIIRFWDDIVIKY
jgi:hypothetical protein